MFSKCHFLVLKIKRNIFALIFLAFGANVTSKMGVQGEELEGVFGGNQLLEKGNHPNYTDKKVAVIGGGNVAMDCARTIKRLGAKEVKIIYELMIEKQLPFLLMQQGEKYTL